MLSLWNEKGWSWQCWRCLSGLRTDRRGHKRVHSQQDGKATARSSASEIAEVIYWQVRRLTQPTMSAAYWDHRFGFERLVSLQPTNMKMSGFHCSWLFIAQQLFCFDYDRGKLARPILQVRKAIFCPEATVQWTRPPCTCSDSWLSAPSDNKMPSALMILFLFPLATQCHTS